MKLCVAWANGAPSATLAALRWALAVPLVLLYVAAVLLPLLALLLALAPPAALLLLPVWAVRRMWRLCV